MADHLDDAMLDFGAPHVRPRPRGPDRRARGFHRCRAAVDLTDDKGDTLLDAGADPAGGSPSAVETAVFFELPAMRALLER